MGSYSIITMAGPKRELDKIQLPDKMFDEVHRFDTGDNYGEFPDTTGYEADNWEEMSSDLEDSNLWPYMQKCMDAVMDFTMKRADMVEKLNFVNIETSLNWPKFGGKVFCCAGFVKYQPAPHPMGNRIVMA